MCLLLVAVRIFLSDYCKFSGSGGNAAVVVDCLSSFSAPHVPPCLRRTGLMLFFPFFSLLFVDPTRVMVSPFSMDVTVGESIVLPCQVSHDHSLDIVFTWSFNGHLIDFEKDGDHFERVGGVSINTKAISLQ